MCFVFICLILGCGREDKAPNQKSKNQIPATIAPDLSNEERQRVDFLATKAKAENGDAMFQTQTANNYAEGRGVEKDMEEALKWYQKAAAQDEPQAQFNLGYMYYNGEVLPLDYPKAVEWFTKSAGQNDSYGQDHLGWMYFKGLGVEKNEKKAVEWFTKSVEQGNERGQYNLGNMYAEGRGVEKDEKEAVKWFRKAAEQGYEPAKTALKKLSP